MPARDSRVRLRKTAPPGMKICDWVGRSAPLDSISWTRGNRLRSAISIARRVLRSPSGLVAPPRTVGSLAVTTHSTPATGPTPVTPLAPTGKSLPQAASGDSSRNAASRSSSSSIRSLASSLPRARWRSTYFRPPPALDWASCRSSSASSSRLAARLARWASASGSSRLTSTPIGTALRPSTVGYRKGTTPPAHVQRVGWWHAGTAMSHPDRSRRRSPEDLVRAVAGAGVDDRRVLAAFRRVRRELFVPQDRVGAAYDDRPVPIAHAQVTTQPSLVGRMVAALRLRGGERVLEVGTGLGFQA